MAGPATPDGAFTYDAALATSCVRDRGLLDDEPSGRHMHHERRVIEVETPPVMQ
jgi:hypothetical protein